MARLMGCSATTVISGAFALSGLLAGVAAVLWVSQRASVDPLDKAIAEGFARHKRRAAFLIHSFTPSMNGEDRAWHAGFLSRADETTAQALIAHVARSEAALALGLNEPCAIEDEDDWFIPVHAETRGVHHSLIEVRNDQLGGGDGVARWADLLADAIANRLEPDP